MERSNRLLALLTPLLPALALASLAPGHAAAAPPTLDLQAKLDALVAPTGLTAESAAERALASDPTVARSRAVVRERQSQVRAVGLRKVPQLAATLGYTRLSAVDSAEVAGFSFPQVLDNWTMKLELSVPLSDYLVRYPALGDAAALRQRAAEADVASASQAAAQGARRLYWQWVRSQLTLIVSEQGLTQLESTVVQMEARVAAQRASRADLLRLRAQAAESRRALIVARERADVDALTLRQAIGAPDEALAIGDNLFTVADPGTPAPVATLLAAAREGRPELRALGLAESALRASRDAAGAGRWPRLDAFAQANYDNPNQRVLLGDEGFTASWAIGAQVKWNLGDFLAAGPAQDELGAQLIQLEADRDKLVRQLEVAIASARQAVIGALASRGAAAEARAAAEESYRVRGELLAADRVTALELIDAESELTRARIQEIDNLVSLRLALSELAYAVGSTR